MLCGFESVSCSCERFGKCCVGLSWIPDPQKGLEVLCGFMLDVTVEHCDFTGAAEGVG